MADLPTFTGVAYATNTVRGDTLLWANPGVNTGVVSDGTSNDLDVYRRSFKASGAMQLGSTPQPKVKDMTANSKSKLRVVRVFLVDPDDRMPIHSRILYRSGEMTTDATDQELFFGIPVNDLLKEHNSARAKAEWEEKTSEGTKSKVGLKDARIRDLVMSVTTIAEFESRASA